MKWSVVFSFSNFVVIITGKNVYMELRKGTKIAICTDVINMFRYVAKEKKKS